MLTKEGKRKVHSENRVQMHAQRRWRYESCGVAALRAGPERRMGLVKGGSGQAERFAFMKQGI